jgi:hypothetical protein
MEASVVWKTNQSCPHNNHKKLNINQNRVTLLSKKKFKPDPER